jgi:hypothetical protein
LRSPASSITALICDVPEFGVEGDSLRLRRRFYSATRVQLDQLAILVYDLALRLRDEAARRAHQRFWRLHEGAPRARLWQLLHCFGFGLGARFAVVECFVADVGDESEARMIVGMIQDQAVGLTVCCAKSPPNHLDEQHLALGRSSQDDAPDVPVDTRGEDAHITHHLDLTSVELAGNLASLVFVRVRIDVPGLHTSSEKFLPQMVCVHAIDGEA